MEDSGSMLIKDQRGSEGENNHEEAGHVDDWPTSSARKQSVKREEHPVGGVATSV